MGLRYYPMKDAPKDTEIRLLIPWNAGSWTTGYWCEDDKCWRYDGDDGGHDTQPIGWLFTSDKPRKP